MTDPKDLTQHMVDNQIDPQLRAERARQQGLDVQTRFVSINPEAPGYEVTCEQCGRKARMPEPVPAGKVVLCPSCVRRLGL